MEAKDRIIAALDVNTLEEAVSLVKVLREHVSYFKVGLQLLTSVGAPNVVAFLHNLGVELLFDGKFDDIPTTVGKASAVVSRLGVTMFNVHASAGIETMAAAVANKGNAVVLAVTVLTSLEENNAHLIFGAPSKAKVLQFARDALLAGVDGVICSPQELPLLVKQPELKGLRKVTPGTRPLWAPSDDQARKMTPGEAILAGADELVIGRPLTNPPADIGTPEDAARRIADEIDEALQKRGSGR